MVKKFFVFALVILGMLGMFTDELVGNLTDRNQVFSFNLIKNFISVPFFAILGVKIRNEMDSLVDSKEKSHWRTMLYFTRIGIFACAGEFVTTLYKKIFEQL